MTTFGEAWKVCETWSSLAKGAEVFYWGWQKRLCSALEQVKSIMLSKSHNHSINHKLLEIFLDIMDEGDNGGKETGNK